MDLRARFSNGADDGGVAGHVLRHIGDNREGGDNLNFSCAEAGVAASRASALASSNDFSGVRCIGSSQWCG